MLFLTPYQQCQSTESKTAKKHKQNGNYQQLDLMHSATATMPPSQKPHLHQAGLGDEMSAEKAKRMAA